MARRINLTAKSDRELLIIAVESINENSAKLDKLNGAIANHEHRITILEVGDKLRWKSGNNFFNSLPSLSPKLLLGIAGGLFVSGSFFAGIGFGIGRALGWW
jgi:hypothetical protein